MLKPAFKIGVKCNHLSVKALVWLWLGENKAPVFTVQRSDCYSDPPGWPSCQPSALLRPSWCGSLSTSSCVDGESMPRPRIWKSLLLRLLLRASRRKIKVGEQRKHLTFKPFKETRWISLISLCPFCFSSANGVNGVSSHGADSPRSRKEKSS